MNVKKAFYIIGLLCLFTSGCSKKPRVDGSKVEGQEYSFLQYGKQDPDELSDPFEVVNRPFFWFNDVLDKVLVRPVAIMYRDLLPQSTQKKSHSILTHVREPITFINDLLQFNFPRALTTFKRFSVNTAFGMFGAFNAAKRLGIPYHKEDFGQTFAVWGLPVGPYLYVPFFGPSTVRDFAGFAVGSIVDPINLTKEIDKVGYTISAARTTVEVIDRRAALLGLTDRLEAESLDYYAATRSLYWQNRRSLIKNGKNLDIGFDEETAGADEGFDFSEEYSE